MWPRRAKHIITIIFAVITASAITYGIICHKSDMDEFQILHKDTANYNPAWPISATEYQAALECARHTLEKSEFIVQVDIINSTTVEFKTITNYKITSDTSSQSSGRLIVAQKSATSWTCIQSSGWHRSADFAPPLPHN